MEIDLIYTDQNKKDIGILKEASLDLAFGSDENNFELILPLSNHCLSERCLIYTETSDHGSVAGLEPGGIVDTIEPDTGAHTITYGGRTWHGILEGHIIEPDRNKSKYIVINQEANAAIKDIIDRLGLNDIFYCSNEDSEINISYFEFDHDPAYTGIRNMVSRFGGKVHFRFDGRRKKVCISCVPFIDYSIDEEWESSQVNFRMKKNFAPPNHFIGMGQGEMEERAIIHIFTDSYGAVMPYTTKSVPLQDSDYILDKSRQSLFGINEVTEKYDSPSASITYNYILLTSVPSDWSENYENYYQTKEDEDGYISFKPEKKTVYNPMTVKPSDWNDDYGDYYIKDGDKYKSVSGVTTDKYVKLTSRPDDWSTNCKDYYTYYTDGVLEEYKSVSEVSHNNYKLQVRKPTDWDSSYSSYFQKNKKGKFVKVEGKKVKRNKKTTTITPTWKKGSYWTNETYSTPPSWRNNYYYKKVSTTSAPTWVSSKYHKKEEELHVPAYVPGGTYKKVEDRYAVIVEEIKEKINEYYGNDALEINLDPTIEYDICDIVGATERVTGMSVSQPITKKILKIKNGIQTIEYKIGDD